MGGPRFVQNGRTTPGGLVRSDSERHQERARRRRKRLIAITVAIAAGILTFFAVRFGMAPVLHSAVDQLFKPVRKSPPKHVAVAASTATTAAKIVAVVVMIGVLRTMWPVKQAR
jgi:hypothetical protein